MAKRSQKMTPGSGPSLTSLDNRYGRWVVGSPTRIINGAKKVSCRCECGKERYVSVSSLIRGRSRSCGCLKRDILMARGMVVPLGSRFGRLTVIKDLGSDGCHRWFVVRCDCGAPNQRCTLSSLRCGDTKSCGCLKTELLSSRATKHGGFGTSEYNIWRRMIERCRNPNEKSWSRYGGRGIKVCERWVRDFSAFLDDVGSRPGEEMTLDRIDNDGNYEPGNVRWATAKQQHRNRNDNRVLAVDGKALCVAEWAEVSGTNPSTIRVRLHRGWGARDAVYGRS